MRGCLVPAQNYRENYRVPHFHILKIQSAGRPRACGRAGGDFDCW
eukprot:SAG22_NODE_13627_length_400_cov_0.681063_1_plen_44_part_01